jgi:hypothetical protein
MTDKRVWCNNSSLVIDHLSSKFSSENVCVAFSYCDYRDQKQQTTENVVIGILRQALTIAKRVPEDVMSALVQRKKAGGTPDLECALRFLSAILRTFDMTYLCIDALDECADDHRWNLIHSLKGLVVHDPTQLPFVRLFFTGRPHMKNYISMSSVTLEASEEDVSAYINYKLGMDTKAKMTDEFKKQIVTEILATSQGMLVISVVH